MDFGSYYIIYKSFEKKKKVKFTHFCVWADNVKIVALSLCIRISLTPVDNVNVFSFHFNFGSLRKYFEERIDFKLRKYYKFHLSLNH